MNLWWVVSLSTLIAAIVTKNINAMAVAGIFAIAGAITYVGVVIKNIFEKKGDKDA